MAQINFIPSGCLLAICLNYGILDGTAQSSLISAWAQHCNNQQGNQGSLSTSKEHPTPYISKQSSEDHITALCLPDALKDDAVPVTREEEEMTKQDGVLWQLLGLRKEATGPLVKPTPQDRVTAIFTAPRTSIAHLRELTQDIKADSPESCVSLFDAEAALL
ncbi:hypothetical protein F4813DRAFT_390141 [Daldinia decipiens]|uniref:uncharacterized protein n=1 Tax=Daldinia decipiens TaxID=326647 RepID=UPI0020C5AC3C|nr:uncharacterized protein F4813DRAFT_390141 [Daldinia decipiens]KAI1657169.1 hypothetical protein F4813DRAFT_390141 [Daldinia decipiens]